MKFLIYIIFLLLIIDTVPANAQKVIIYINKTETAPRPLAEQLKEELEKVNKLSVSIVTTEKYSGERGIYLTQKAQDTWKQYDKKLDKYNSEGFYIEADPGKSYAYMVGNSSLALRHAIYTYLEQLGFRYFFPHPVWHVIPEKVKLYPSTKILTQPDYDYRRIWYAYGTNSKEADQDYQFWVKANRTAGAFQVNAGHAYEQIIRRNQKAFDQHPEYYALQNNGSRKPTRNPKFCYSNQQLIRLVIEDALQQFADAEREGKTLNMISLEPSDGGGHCSCDECKALGSISNRVFHLANEVAYAIEEKYPDKWVGLLAYNQHTLPPDFDLNSNIFVMVATAFNQTKYSTDELIQMWGDKVTKLGIYDYFGVMAWDWDMPGQPRGARLNYVENRVKFYSQNNASSLSAETNIGWISRGLGHYLATKLLWNTEANVEEIEDDFFHLAFREAEKPMRSLYASFQKNANIPPTEFDIAEWLELINQAERSSRGEAGKARINQIKYYIHYVALFHSWRNARSQEKRQAYTSLLNYVWRVKSLGVCASYPLIRSIANSKAPSKEYKFDNKNAVWKEPADMISVQELNKMIAQDQVQFKKVKDLENVSYSHRMKTTKVDKEAKVFERNPNVGTHRLLVNIPDNQGEYMFNISSGHIRGKTAIGSIIFKEYNQQEGTIGKTIAEYDLAKEAKLSLNLTSFLSPGTYQVIINDRNSGFRFNTSQNYFYSFLADSQHKINTWDRSNFYFYVPEGTKKFVIIRSIVLTLKSPAGRELSYEQDRRQQIEVEVKERESGFWRILKQKGSFYLEGLPPYVGPSPQQMLLPEGIF